MNKIGKLWSLGMHGNTIDGNGKYTGKHDNLPGNITTNAFGCSRATQVLMELQGHHLQPRIQDLTVK